MISYPRLDERRDTIGKVTRKRYGADFKAKVALDAIRGEQTLAELAAKHGIHQTMIAGWKRQAIEGLATTFSGKPEMVQANSEAELSRLHAKIGQLVVARPNQAWCSDITYIPMRHGFLYLVAIMDWHSRRVLSWRLSKWHTNFVHRDLEVLGQRVEVVILWPMPPWACRIFTGSVEVGTKLCGQMLLRQAGASVRL